eukprot:9187290-Alexandrium_andersonii.AAC.1
MHAFWSTLPRSRWRRACPWRGCNAARPPGVSERRRRCVAPYSLSTATQPRDQGLLTRRTLGLSMLHPADAPRCHRPSTYRARGAA